MYDLDLTVTAVTADASSIRTLTLQGDSLPSYVPGSHVMLDCGGRANAYSLTGEGNCPSCYQVSVLHCPDGGGGSSWLHHLAVGDRVRASRPRSRFAPVLRAGKHLYVAGGIGITPVLAHIRAAVLWSRPFELFYGYRPGSGAHLAELAELAQGFHAFTDRARLAAAVEQALARQPLGTHLYVCGPPPLMDFCLSQAAILGWPESRLHQERFHPEERDPGRPFRLLVPRSGLELQVAAGVSVLDTLDAAGIEIPRLCRQGVCGECRVPVLAGRPEHRDNFLTEAEKHGGTSLMACVSRSLDPDLELDL